MLPSCAIRTPGGGWLEGTVERRSTRRFSMALPVAVRSGDPGGPAEYPGQTRDVSFRGLYFFATREFEVGSKIEFVLTLPKEITLATDVHIRCTGLVVRTEEQGGRSGVAARIERYEFLPKN
jgi:PilZ domain